MTPTLLEVPEPPRRVDGKIDWEKVSDESLGALLKVFSQRRLAVSWETSRFTLSKEIAKRRGKQQRDGTAVEDLLGGRPYQYERPRRLKLFELLWTMPATHIADDIGCSQATILGWAKEDGVKGPGHRYWQRKKSGIKVELPAEIKALYLKLRAEAPPEEQLGEIPEVFRSSETKEATGLEEPVDVGQTSKTPSEPATAGGPTTAVEASNSKRRGPQRIILNLSKADLLEQRWLKPATRLAEELRLSHSALLQKCRDLGLGPFLPPEKYWASRKSGDPIAIPEEIQAVIAQLRTEAVCACEGVVILEEQHPRILTDTAVDRCLSPVQSMAESGHGACPKFREVPSLPLLSAPIVALGFGPRVASGPVHSSFQRWRWGSSDDDSEVEFEAQKLSRNPREKRDVWAPARGKPPPPGECANIIYRSAWSDSPLSAIRLI